MNALGPRTPHESVDLQIEALERALARGELEADALIDRLGGSSWMLRRVVVSALASMGERALPALLHALVARRDDEARIAALVDALAGSVGRVELQLQPLAAHPDPAVVADVAQILGRRRTSAGLPILIALTEHADDNVAVAAIEGLGRSDGQSAVDALVACVSGSNFFRVFPAIDVLGRSGDPRAIAPLSRLLKNPRYAFEAARALGRTADRAAVAPLLTLLSMPSEASLRNACLALSELCERHDERYGVTSTIELLIFAGRSDNLLRRLGHTLSTADKAEKIAICRVLGALQGGAATRFILPLLEGEPEVAEAAGKALAQLGRDSNSAIADALREPHSARRAVLLPGVTRLDHAESVLACLDDRAANVRALAAEALARIGCVAATPLLFVRLADESPRVAHAASAAIQALGSGETEGLALEAANSPLREVRRGALRILAYFGYESALPLFQAALQEEASDPRTRDAAMQGLTLLENPEARALLLRLSTDTDEKLRAAAMRALGQVTVASDTRERLQFGLTDSDPWVRYYACQALGRQRADDAVDAVVTLLSDPAGQVRVSAIEALSHMTGERAIQALRQAARDSDPDMRRAGLLGLGLSRDQASLPVFLEALREPDAATRLIALSALANFGGSEPTQAFALAARDEDESVRAAAIGFLQTAADPQANIALIALVREERDRKRALDALAHPSAGAEPMAIRVAALLEGLGQADDTLAPLLASCLSKLGGEIANDALIHAITLPNRLARLAAANALSALGTSQAYSALARAAESDPDDDVRRVCALHLAG